MNKGSKIYSLSEPKIIETTKKKKKITWLKAADMNLTLKMLKENRQKNACIYILKIFVAYI